MRHIFELTTSQFGNANSVPRLDFIWRVFGTKFPAEVAKIVVHILGFFKIIPFKVKLLWKLLEKIVIFNWNIWSHCNGKFWIFYFSIETSGHTVRQIGAIFQWKKLPARFNRLWAGVKQEFDAAATTLTLTSTTSTLAATANCWSDVSIVDDDSSQLFQLFIQLFNGVKDI